MAAMIGVVGGMGPDATNALCALLTSVTPARSDIEHIPVITFNNPKIPSRVEAMAGGPSPVVGMIQTAQTLVRAGAELLVIPCNLAHVWLEEVRSAVDVPVLDMVAETAACLAQKHEEARLVGVLASTPTNETGLYRDALARIGLRTLEPRPDEQAAVMDAIYGPGGVKAGGRDGPRATLENVARGLVDGGADLILAACSEVSLVLTRRLTVPLVDPLRLLAEAAVAWASAGRTSEERGAMESWAGS